MKDCFAPPILTKWIQVVDDARHSKYGVYLKVQNNGLTIELYSRYMTQYKKFHQYHCTYDVRNYYHKVL